MSRPFNFCFILFITWQSFIKAQPCPLNIVPSSYSVCAGFHSTITAFGANSYTWTGSTFTAPVISQSVTGGQGTYTVTGNTHTCSVSIVIGLQPPLNIQVSQSSATTCIASNLLYSHPVTLMPSGAGAYTWNPPIPQFPLPSNIYTVFPGVSSCYTVIGSTSNCSGTAVACVTVVPQFSIAVSPEVSSICKGESIGLSVSQVGPGEIGPASAFIYTWTDTDTSLNAYNSKAVIASPSAGTGYTVVVSDEDGCLSTPATATVAVNVCTGVQESKSKQATLFPNPFDDYLNINAPEAVLIELIDVFGKRVMLLTPGAETMFRVDTRSLLPGIYFVTITNSALQKKGVKLIRN